MTIADVLQAEFAAAAEDLERGKDRAADAATAYIVRRLQQLERRFPRHRFILVHRGLEPTLYVFPAVAKTNFAGSVIRIGRDKRRWPVLARLWAVERDMSEAAMRVWDHFDRILGFLNTAGLDPWRIPISAPTEARRVHDAAMCNRIERAAAELNRRPRAD